MQAQTQWRNVEVDIWMGGGPADLAIRLEQILERKYGTQWTTAASHATIVIICMHNEVTNWNKQLQGRNGQQHVDRMRETLDRIRQKNLWHMLIDLMVYFGVCVQWSQSCIETF